LTVNITNAISANPGDAVQFNLTMYTYDTNLTFAFAPQYISPALGVTGTAGQISDAGKLSCQF